MMVLTKYLKELTHSPGFLHPQIRMLWKAYFVPSWVFVFQLVCDSSSASWESYSQAAACWFSYAFFLPRTNEAINKEGKIKIGLSKQHQSGGAGNRKQLPEEANAFIANSTSKQEVSSSLLYVIAPYIEIINYVRGQCCLLEITAIETEEKQMRKNLK